MSQDYPVFSPQDYAGIITTTTTTTHQSCLAGGCQPGPDPLSATNEVMKSLSPSKYGQMSANYTRSNSRITNEVVKGESTISYVPIEKKVIDYIDRPQHYLVENKRFITDYREQTVTYEVPRQITVTDYYAIQYVRCYVPEVIPETHIEYIPKQLNKRRRQYIPVERQILHYPIHSHEDQAPRYLGVEETGPKKYLNVTDDDYNFWEQEYGYVRGQPIQELNRKIRQKYQREKNVFFTAEKSHIQTQQAHESGEAVNLRLKTKQQLLSETKLASQRRSLNPGQTQIQH